MRRSSRQKNLSLPCATYERKPPSRNRVGSILASGLPSLGRVKGGLFETGSDLGDFDDGLEISFGAMWNRKLSLSLKQSVVSGAEDRVWEAGASRRPTCHKEGQR
jgi:hypothetical protein